MSFWERHMPRGMLLRSPVASNIADPQGELTLDSFQSEERLSLSRPLGVRHFVDYGRWFQRHASPSLDAREVTRVESNGAFQLELSDGSTLLAARVVVAAGIKSFAWRPEVFRELPDGLVSHASDHDDLLAACRTTRRRCRRRPECTRVGGSPARGRRGRGAVGACAANLLLAARAGLTGPGPVTRLLFAPAEVGPAGESRLFSAPGLYRRLPRAVQDPVQRAGASPGGCRVARPSARARTHQGWHKRRPALPAADELELRLGDGSTRRYDHVLLATGYRVDISAYPFLTPAVLGRVDRVAGYPRLSGGFESSLLGLHFPARRLPGASAPDALRRRDRVRGPAARAGACRQESAQLMQELRLPSVEQRRGTGVPMPKPRRAGAVVLGSDYRGLAIVRSLGRLDIPVWVVCSGDDSLAARSRYATRRLPLTGATDAERSAFLCELATDHGLDGWVLFPTADETAALVSRAHEELSELYALTTPPWDVLRWAYDKRLTYALAGSLMLPHPQTWSAGSVAEAAALQTDFPVLIKPAVKEEFNRLTAAKAWRADDAEQLAERSGGSDARRPRAAHDPGAHPRRR